MFKKMTSSRQRGNDNGHWLWRWVCRYRNDGKTMTMTMCVTTSLLLFVAIPGDAMLADRARVVRHRQDSGRSTKFTDNGKHIEGQNYRVNRLGHAKKQMREEMNTRIDLDYNRMEGIQFVNDETGSSLEGSIRGASSSSSLAENDTRRLSP